MNTDLAQWLFDNFREVAARRALSKFEMSIMRNIQIGFTKFTREAYEQILEVLKENAERKETSK